MRCLIAIKSCKRDWMRGDHSVIRSTWGKDVPVNVDLRFFIKNCSYQEIRECNIVFAVLLENGEYVYANYYATGISNSAYGQLDIETHEVRAVEVVVSKYSLY